MTPWGELPGTQEWLFCSYEVQGWTDVFLLGCGGGISRSWPMRRGSEHCPVLCHRGQGQWHLEAHFLQLRNGH